MILSALPAVDPTSTSYQLGYWSTRIGLCLLVAFFVGRYLLRRWRESRGPSASAPLGVPVAPGPAPWLAPPDSAVTPAAVVATEPIAPPAKGKHAR